MKWVKAGASCGGGCWSVCLKCVRGDEEDQVWGIMDVCGIGQWWRKVAHIEDV